MLEWKQVYFLDAGMDTDYFLHAGMDTRLSAVLNGGCTQLLWLSVIHHDRAVDIEHLPCVSLQFVYNSVCACTKLCSISLQN